ncbi:uncharacterized protein LOC111277492 [Durio zibethinus]|uniref:Uncharacterized protein LOC111277492 n=1 Tax=Durio zibethinus TaxID=66656 RepID=A0A6P5WU45_DURZI|nr:uncharacterized protein LOC111277492 [Durio zibethinus]
MVQGRLMNKISGKFPDFGAIFMSNASTREECLKRKLFGLPMSSADFVKGVKVGMILFLFEYEKRELYGVFKATTDGELNIVLHAYRSSGKKFPAQVFIMWFLLKSTMYSALHLSRSDLPQSGTAILFGNMNFRWLLEIITSLQTNSTLGCLKIRYHEASLEKREMEKDWSNHTQIGRKKLKQGIDSDSQSNGEPLAYSGKLTVAKDESQLLDSGDSHTTLKESDSMHYNCPCFPESPCSQRSLPFVAVHSSTSGQELGPHPDHAIQSQPVSVGQELQELETPGNLDIDLGDYIPLLPSDDSDSDTRASPESGCFMTDQIGLPFSASDPYEDTWHPVPAASPITKAGDFYIKENSYSLKSPVENCQANENSDYINQYTSVRGLYSDASNNRSSVFSRLNFSSGVQDKEDDTRVEKSAHRTRKQQKCGTRVDKSVQQIMEELQQKHDKWKKMVRTTRSVERQNEHTVNTKTSVFLRLNSTSAPDVQDNYISTRLQERHDKQRNMRETKFPVSGGNKPSVFLRLSRTSEPEVHNNGISTLLQARRRHDKQSKIGETECHASGKKSHSQYMVSPICLNSENEEIGKSLTATDSDGVELDNNTSPDVTRPLKTDKHHHLPSNSLQEVYENLTDNKGKSDF